MELIQYFCLPSDYVTTYHAHVHLVIQCIGHDGVVLSACWNHSGQWLLTCSTDKTARVWAIGHKDPLLTLNTVQHNFSSSTTKVTKVNADACTAECRCL